MMTPLVTLLNDCTIIRTTFETFDLFQEEDPIRKELWELIAESQNNLLRHCKKVRNTIVNTGIPGVKSRPPVDNEYIFLDSLPECTNADNFRKMMLTLLASGYPRRRIDACMKLNVFCYVAKLETGEHELDPLYRYELSAPLTISAVSLLDPRRLAVALFEDLLQNIQEPANFTNQFAFSRNVFQKYTAILFACYAATDPLFYA